MGRAPVRPEVRRLSTASRRTLKTSPGLTRIAAIASSPSTTLKSVVMTCVPAV